MFVRALFSPRCAVLACAFAVSACASHAAVPDAPISADGARAESSTRAALPSSSDVLYAGMSTALGSSGSQVDAFTETGASVGAIFDGLGGTLGGIAVDPKGRLYVNEALVIVYPHGNPVPAGFYPVGPVGVGNPAHPAGLAVGKKSLYVEMSAVGAYKNAFLFEFPITSHPLGETKPERTISLPSGVAGGIALDAGQNLYVNYSAVGVFPQTGKFLEFPAGSTKGKPLPMHVGSPGPGLAIDSQGNLVTCDNEFGKIEVFAKNKKGNFGRKPSRTIDKGLTNCASLVFSSDGRTLYVDNQPLALGNYGVPAAINAYDYASGKLERKIATGFEQPAGTFLYLAVNPVALASPAP